MDSCKKIYDQKNFLPQFAKLQNMLTFASQNL